MKTTTAKQRWATKRRGPYTARGITQVPCVRCGAPACHQWQICADDRLQRAVCLECDIELNTLVLMWAGDPDWRSKVKKYAAAERAKA